LYNSIFGCRLPAGLARILCRSIALSLLSAVALTACSHDETIRPDENTTLRIGVAAPRAGPTIGISGLITNLAHEPLVSVGWDGRPTSKLAASWEWSPDGREIRFDLEPNVKFHDGTAFTAAHARDALLPRLKDKNAHRVSISYSSVQAVEAKGDRTVVIRLVQPEAFFLADLMNTSLSHPQNPALGTGPFRREGPVDRQGSAKESIKLVAFDQYYRGKPGVDAVEIVPYEEQRSAWAAFMRGDIDAVHEASPNAMDFVERQKSVRTYSMTRPYYMHLLFNLGHRDLKKAGVRQALSHAVDRQAIIASALNDRGIAANSPLWPQHWAYVEAPRRYGYNTEAARLLLDRAGYPVLRPKDDNGAPKRFEFKCLTVANDARFEKIALLVQKQLHDIAVDMHVEAVPLNQLGQRMAKGDFDALLIELTSGRSLTWAYTTYHSSTAPGQYRAADAVLERLRRARTEPETRQGVSDLLQILYDDPPAVFIAWPQVARVVSTKFVIPEDPAGRDVLGSLWKWKLASPEGPR
jgi:peptide/nickel transport system substrate-binding protein